MATNNIELGVVITAKDEASGTLDALQKQAGSIGKTFTVVGGLMAGALGLAVKSASDAQVQMARMDTTLASMAGTSIKVSTGVATVADGLKYTGAEAEKVNLAIADTETALKKTEMKTFT